MLGVAYNKRLDKYGASITWKGTRKYLGHFSTEFEAFSAYKPHKEAQLHLLAEKGRTKIDQKAYNALLNWQIEETD